MSALPAPTSEPQSLPGLVEGRLVHYVLPDGPQAGEHRPAVIVKVWDHGVGTVNLQVFTDGANDGARYGAGLSWATSVLFSEEPQARTWHWIERA